MDKHRDPSQEEPSRSNAKLWIGFVLVVIVFGVIGMFRFGALTGRATGEDGAVGGCGGPLPSDQANLASQSTDSKQSEKLTPKMSLDEHERRMKAQQEKLRLAHNKVQPLDPSKIPARYKELLTLSVDKMTRAQPMKRTITPLQTLQLKLPEDFHAKSSDNVSHKPFQNVSLEQLEKRNKTVQKQGGKR